jgi:hypothetical protein
MKSLYTIIAATSFGASSAFGQAGADFTNFFKQVELPFDGSPGTEEIVYVPEAGQQLSPLAINPGGARFELWAINNKEFKDYLLDHKYVSAETPMAEIRIVTEDPFEIYPRTRADRPFDVWVRTAGIVDIEDAAASVRAVRLKRHVQSYGIDGTSASIDTSQASLLQEVFLNESKDFHFSFSVTAIPGENRAKVRGQERFSVYSIEDTQSPSSQLGAMHVEVWPVATGSISGLTDGETLRFNTPQLTIAYEDLYPGSRTQAQVYPGPPTLGKEGVVVPGSAILAHDAIPENHTRVLDRWDTVIDQDGQWTLELVTYTPFGVDRLDYVTFNINRSIEVQGSVTTSD